MPDRFVPRGRIPAKVVRVEDDGPFLANRTFLANRLEKETGRTYKKAGGEEGGATSIYDDIILVYFCQWLLLYGLFEREGYSNARLRTQAE